MWYVPNISAANKNMKVKTLCGNVGVAGNHKVPTENSWVCRKKNKK
jgi:hypothetical protein